MSDIERKLRPFIFIRVCKQTIFTFKDVSLGCKVQSDGKRHHKDSEEEQSLQGRDQGTLISAGAKVHITQPK